MGKKQDERAYATRNFANDWDRAGTERRVRRGVSFATLAFGLAAPVSVFAQVAPPDVTPPTREELVPPEARDPQRPLTTLTIDGSMERTPCALDNPEYADIAVTLTSVRFEGAEKAPDVSLVPTYEGYLGRELPLAVLCDIRAAANQRLQEAGYLATVEIPAQRLSGGDAELRIVFGRVTALRVRGDAGPSEQLVASYLERLTQDEVFNTRRAERYLLLADDLPGVDVRLSLRPAANGTPGDLIGEIAVVRRRGAIDLNVQNYGSPALGRFGALLRGEIYDLTGLGDRTGVSAFSTVDFEEQQTVQLSHDFALGGSGVRLGGQFTYSWTNPDLDLPGFEVESETLFTTLSASYPVIRARESTHVASAGLDYVDQDVFVNDIRLTRDRVRTAFLRLDSAFVDSGNVAGAGGYSQYEPMTRIFGSLELRRGLGILESSPDCRPSPLACVVGGIAPPSRIESDPTGTSVRFDAAAEYRPIPDIKFSLAADGQYSGDPLPAFEEFSAGNYSIGRGYDPGSILGDSGIALAFEVAYRSLAPQSAKLVAWQPYVFTDVAWAWNEDPSRRPLNPDRLWSVGGGFRFAFGSSVRADVALAVPLEETDLDPDRGDPRLLISLTTRLFPWSF